MSDDLLTKMRKLNQQYAYTSIQMHEAVAQKAGFSGTDHKYLGFLLQNGQMTAGELASLTGLTTGAVTGLIDRFEKKKLVKRQFAKDDRRKVIVVPDIPRIMALLEPLYNEYRTESEKLNASFSEKEMEVIQTYFQRSIEIMSNITGKLNDK